MSEEFLPPRVASARLGVSTKTLERWLEAGKIKAFITPGGQRRYDLSSVTSDQADRRTAVIYARVSCRSQKADLDRQIDFLQSHYPQAQVIKDIGSGLNYNRKGLQTLLERVLSDDVRLVIVAHKDRLCRFGFDLISWLCNYKKCEILVLNQTHLSPEREMVEEILAIIHVFSCRLYGLRKYKKKITEDSDIPSLSAKRTGKNLETMGKRG